MNITAIRSAIADELAEFGEVQVLLAPTEYAKSFGPVEDVKMIARILVGPAGDPATEELVDNLFESVPEKLQGNKDLGGAVQMVMAYRCSGHKTFATEDGPIMGAEWALNVYGAD